MEQDRNLTFSSSSFLTNNSVAIHLEFVCYNNYKSSYYKHGWDRTISPAMKTLRVQNSVMNLVKTFVCNAIFFKVHLGCGNVFLPYFSISINL